jgi:hypothetical protein
VHNGTFYASKNGNFASHLPIIIIPTRPGADFAAGFSTWVDHARLSADFPDTTQCQLSKVLKPGSQSTRSLRPESRGFKMSTTPLFQSLFSGANQRHLNADFRSFSWDSSDEPACSLHHLIEAMQNGQLKL